MIGHFCWNKKNKYHALGSFPRSVCYLSRKKNDEGCDKPKRQTERKGEGRERLSPSLLGRFCFCIKHTQHLLYLLGLLPHARRWSRWRHTSLHVSLVEDQQLPLDDRHDAAGNFLTWPARGVRVLPEHNGRRGALPTRRHSLHRDDGRPLRELLREIDFDTHNCAGRRRRCLEREQEGGV